MFKTAIESATLIASALVQRLRYHKPLPAEFNPQRILVIKLDHLGDVLLATPVFSNLRHVYPGAQIHALVGEWGAIVLRNHLDVDAIIQYDARFFRRSGQSTHLREAARLFRNLHREKYDLIIELRGDWLTAIFGLFKGSRYRLSRASLQIANRLGRAQFTGGHEVDRNLDVLRSVQISTPLREVTFHPHPTDKTWVDNYFNRLGVAETCCLIAIHPGSPVALKRWRPERFAAIADWLIARKNAHILFVGVRTEIPIIAAIQKQMRNDSINIAGQTTVSQLAEILKRCDLFLGNDSGPMHLAAAVATRTIGLYGPGHPQRFSPIGSHCQTIRRKPDCPPCMGTSCKFGGEGCMKEIEIGDVIQVIEEGLVQ